MSKTILQIKYPQQAGGTKTNATHILNLTQDQQKLLKDTQAITNKGIKQLTIAALLIYFGKISIQTEFIFGIHTPKRNYRPFIKMEEIFIGILPFKGIYQPNIKLTDLLKKIVILQKTDYPNADYTTSGQSNTLEAIAIEDRSYQISIDHQPSYFKFDFGPQLRAQVVNVSNHSKNNPLHVCWLENTDDKSLKLRLQYSNAYFNQSEIELFAMEIIFILGQFAISLDKNVAEITITPHPNT